MKRKNWVSILCGGFLLLTVASPVTAAGWDLAQPRPAVLEMVIDWFSGWLPAESWVPAGKKGGEEPGEQVVASSCEPCSECDLDSCIDPDG